MAAQGIWAAVPIKRTAESKQRLAPVLSPLQRQTLALAMLEDVLTALRGAASLSGIAVVTVDPAAAAIAGRYGAAVLSNDANAGHTAAVEGAMRSLGSAGCDGVLALPGDIPLVTAADIERVLASHGSAPCMTIVPSRDELGSNAVLASPPGAVPLRFGEDSYHPHLRAARKAGVAARSLAVPAIALDIDTPDDLAAFLATPSITAARRYLEGIGATRQGTATTSG